MKRISLILICLVGIVCQASAQDYKALECFMTKYSSTWARQSVNKSAGELEQIGKPMPEFNFNKELNSKKLKGKFVVLNFWATWCGGCRLLSVDLDSLMVKQSDEYQDIQLIGVDCKEKMADKGYVAADFWKKKNIGYPSVYGKSADACCDAVQAGHPCAMLIDGDGIVRGRWDAWTPTTANDIRLAAWALYVVPKNNIKADIETVMALFEGKKYWEALYLLEMIPDGISTAALRFEVMMNCDGRAALDYFNSVCRKYEKEKTGGIDDWIWKPAPEYVKAMKDISDYISLSTTQDEYLLKVGCDAFRVFLNHGGQGGDYHHYVKNGMLVWRYGEAIRKRGERNLESALDMAKRQEVSASEIANIQNQLDAYKKQIRLEEQSEDKSNQRMLQDKQDEDAHKASLQNKNL